MYSLSHSWTHTNTRTRTHSNYSDTFTGLHSKQRANTHSLQRGEVICWFLTTTTTHTHTQSNTHQITSPNPKTPTHVLRGNPTRCQNTTDRKKERGEGIREGREGRKRGYRTNLSEKNTEGGEEEGEEEEAPLSPPSSPPPPPLLLLLRRRRKTEC